MHNHIDSRKVLGTVIGGIFFLVCILFFTYAYYVWRSPQNTVVSFTIQDASKVCEMGPNVDVENIGPILDYNDGVTATFEMENLSSDTETFSLSLEITSITDTLLVDSFKYILLVGDVGGTTYTETGIAGSFTDFVVGTNLISDSISIASKTSKSYKFIVYIDGTVYNNENMQQNSLNSNLVVGCDAIGTVD